MYKCALGKMSGCPEGFDKFPLANREIDFPNLYRANIVWNKKIIARDWSLVGYTTTDNSRLSHTTASGLDGKLIPPS